ncbi:MAG: metal-sulfur cluster assembly factor [Rhodocyclales bacterium GT-UBC]|nr:MAG: metal-sulfur cluster assembly factor [Rhodocyclales bacterium GT-UBC]
MPLILDLQPPFEADSVYTILRRVIDPEVGVNILDLGLVYAVRSEAKTLHIELTMTSPACPMGDLILDDLRREMDRALPDDCAAEIRLVWSPPWDPSMMSPDSKAHFGWGQAN